jgi:hypothetical protein
MNEQELERIAAGLGRTAGERLDVDGVARAVVARLRAVDNQPVRQPPIMRWLAAAAAVVLMVGSALVTFGTGGAGPGRGAAYETDLYDLSAVELAEVLDSLSWTTPVSLSVSATLDDLSAEQLQELLARMEG